MAPQYTACACLLPAMRCWADDECDADAGEICHDGECGEHVMCTADAQCESFEFCDRRVCALAADCATDDDCGGPKECVDYECLKPCTLDDDCAGTKKPRVCEEGYCAFVDEDEDEEAMLFGGVSEADVEIEPEYFAYSGFATSAVEDDMTLNLEVDGKVMEITMTGPADSWFGWGLDSSTMQDTYAIIVHEDGVTEHKLSKKSEDQADTEMELDLVVVRSDTTEGNVRTVRLTRTSVGGDNHQNDVVDSEGDFDVISARSDPANPSMSVAQHTKSSRGGMYICAYTPRPSTG